MGEILKLRNLDDRNTKFNMLGEVIEPCGCEPMTGWFRDGSCATEESDYGHHVVCCVMNEEFLKFSMEIGNDLSTPRPEHDFPGLKPGDRWCLCALRWKQALEHGKAPPVIMQSTHLSALSVISIDLLRQYSWDGSVMGCQ
jgi:uncharacterized protein (DUF2237 family)